MQPERPKNRLAQERSPYLQQHATNPVDWRPWSEAAFDEARQTGKPVFLSIGYSACHWCHVMEHESFADESTAALLNRDFISIKVDREERPDIDHIYQLAFQLLHQRGGGWPLSIFLTPDKQPFFAGTYFPPARRYGMPSFQEVLHAIGSAYKERRADVLAQAQELTEVLGRVTQGAKEQAGPLSPEALSRVVSSLSRRIDKTHGGFGTKPKFPNVMSVELLLLGYALEGNAEAWTLASRTLRGMARGGIYDHLGGGFARYSTDERWLVPHFEKMLYDNGLLLRLYLDGWRLAREAGGEISPQHCQEILEETTRYLAREMTASNGAFFSAQDADSEGEEGKFFVWTPKQVASLLEISDAEAACAYFDISDAGNFEHGATVLATPREFSEVAARLRRPEPELRAAIGRAKEAMFAAREKREKPFRDEKCLASWNGLVIGALADAGASLERSDWVEMAARGLAAWREVAWKNGRLSHAMKDGEPYGDGFLDDYAGLANAALDLFEARFDSGDLRFARELTDKALALFWDEAEGDCYHTPQDGELVLHRAKDAHDQAYPGGVGLMAQALLRLATMTGEASYRERAERLLQSTARAAGENPMGLSTVARAIDWAARGSVEVVIVGEVSSEAGRALLRGGRGVYVPHRSLVAAPSAEAAQALGLSRLLFEGRAPLPDGRPRAYVCRGQLCEAPVSDPEALRALLLQYARATH